MVDSDRGILIPYRYKISRTIIESCLKTCSCNIIYVIMSITSIFIPDARYNNRTASCRESGWKIYSHQICCIWATFPPLYNNTSHLNITISCFRGNDTFKTCQFRALITRLCHSMKIEADNANCWGKALFYKKCRYNLHQPCNYRWRVCNFLNKYYICLSYL